MPKLRVFPRCRPILGLILTMTLGACSSTPELPPPHVSQLNPRITSDGSKHFSYIYRYQINPAKGEGGPSKSDENYYKLKQLQETKALNAKKERIEEALEIVDNIITTTQYCREGYQILRKSHVFPEVIVEGECKEGASPEEATRFTPKVTPKPVKTLGLKVDPSVH